MEFESHNKDTTNPKEITRNKDSMMCKVGIYCSNAIICNILACIDFSSKVQKKGDKELDKNDDRHDFIY